MQKSLSPGVIVVGDQEGWGGPQSLEFDFWPLDWTHIFSMAIDVYLEGWIRSDVCVHAVRIFWAMHMFTYTHSDVPTNPTLKISVTLLQECFPHEAFWLSLNFSQELCWLVLLKLHFWPGFYPTSFCQNNTFLNSLPFMSGWCDLQQPHSDLELWVQSGPMREDSVSRSCKASPVYFCLNYMFCICGEWMKIEAVSKWTRESLQTKWPLWCLHWAKEIQNKMQEVLEVPKCQKEVSKGSCYAMLCLVTLPTSLAAAAKSLQLCPTLCDPIDGSPPGSPIPGILQARTLEWVAISFSNA